MITPPRRPQLPGDPDPLHVELQPVDERVPWHDSRPGRLDEPAPAWLAWFGFGVCVGILLGALIMVAGLWLRTAPSSAPDPTSSSAVLDVRPGSASPSIPLTATSGPELSGAPPALPVTMPAHGAPSPTGEIGTALVGGWATWCGPTDTQCQGWGGDALLGATPSFVDGDRPYDVRVCSDAGDCVTVRVVSFCGCADRRGRPTVIDLSPAAFEQLAPLRRGLVLVTVEWPLS